MPKILISVSGSLEEKLEQLARQGILGTTKTGVARAIISRYVHDHCTPGPAEPDPERGDF